MVGIPDRRGLGGKGTALRRASDSPGAPAVPRRKGERVRLGWGWGGINNGFGCGLCRRRGALGGPSLFLDSASAPLVVIVVAREEGRVRNPRLERGVEGGAPVGRCLLGLVGR